MHVTAMPLGLVFPFGRASPTTRSEISDVHCRLSPLPLPEGGEQVHFSRAMTLLCAFTSLPIAGCDPVRAVLQPVDLRVTTPPPEHAVSGAHVFLQYEYGRNDPPPEEAPTRQQSWEQALCDSDTTDEDGKVTICMKSMGIDRSIGPQPPVWRNLRGRSCMVRVGRNEAQEELRVVMRPGASAQGRYFTVSIRDVGKPRYVKVDP